MANAMYGTGMGNMRPADWVGQPWKVMLLNTTATFDIGTTSVATLAANEVSGTGYVGGFGGAGRKTLASKSINFTGGVWAMLAANLTWSAIDVGIIGAAVVILEVTNDADSYPVARIGTGFPFLTDGNDYLLEWNANGVMRCYNVSLVP